MDRKEDDGRLIEGILSESKNPKRAKYVYDTLKALYSVFVLLVVLAVSSINNRVVEIAIVLLVFFPSRRILGKCWHSDKLLACFLVSNAVFYVVSCVVLPVRVSAFACVLAGGGLAYALAYIADIEKWKNTHNQYCGKENEIVRWKSFFDRHNLFDPTKCDEATMLERCRMCGLSREDAEICVKLFVFKLPMKNIAAELDMQYSTLRTKKMRLKIKLATI